MKYHNMFKFKYLATIIFLITIVVMFFCNIRETAINMLDNTTEVKAGAVAADLDNVEAGTYTFININGLYQGLMKRDYMYDANEADEIIRADGKYLVSALSPYSNDEITKSAEGLKATSEWLLQYGIPMLYVQGASKMSISDREIMPGIENTTYDKVNGFLQELRERGITYADTREWIADEDMAAFYRTDHHWKTETCLSVSEKICKLLNSKYYMSLDDKLFAESSFLDNTYKKSFLGAEGRRTGIYYVGLDDFTVIEPKYETDFAVEIHTKDGEVIRREGSFELSVMDKSKDPSSYSFEDSAYYIYWGGDYSSVHIDNKRDEQGEKLVVIKDSYGIPVTAMMSGAFDSIDIFDIRYYNEDKTLSQAILECDPDVVVFIYGPGYLTEPYMFDIFS